MSSTKHQTYSEDETYNLLNFAGFGQVEADLWFFDYAPTLPSGVSLDGFTELEQMTGITEACLSIGMDADTFNASVLNGNGMLFAELMLKLLGKPYTESDTVEFFLNSFLSDEGSAFYLPMFPIPLNPEVEANFSTIFPMFKSFDSYLQKGKKLRVEFIQELVSQFAPKTIFAILTDEQRELLKEVFPQYHFEDHNGIYAGWDTMTIILVMRPEDFTALNLPRIAEFINENSLPMDLRKEYGPTRLSQAELDRMAKEEAKKVSAAKRKNKAKHDPSDPFCVCEKCLKY